MYKVILKQGNRQFVQHGPCPRGEAEHYRRWLGPRLGRAFRGEILVVAA